MQQEKKICRRCGIEKRLNGFYKSKNHTDGYTHICMDCNKKQKLQYYYENKEHLLQKHKEWAQENRIKRNAYKRKLYQKNPEKYRQSAKEWREKNPDKQKEVNKKATKKWKEKNKEAYKKMQKDWSERNREKRREYGQKWNDKNPEKRKFLSKNANHNRRQQIKKGNFTKEEWDKILFEADYKCHYCKSKKEKLSIDHVIPLSKGGEHKAYNIVPACLKCNSRKNAKVENLL